MTLTVGKVVSFWNLIIWVQYLLESVLSEWMESNKAEIWCSLGIFGSWELSSDFKASSTGSVWFCLNSEYWIQKLEPFLVWGFCFKTVTGLYTTFPWDIQKQEWKRLSNICMQAVKQWAWRKSLRISHPKKPTYCIALHQSVEVKCSWEASDQVVTCGWVWCSNQN